MSSAVVTLERMPISAVVEEDLESEVTPERSERARLFGALRDLAIHPYTPESVAQYKVAFARRANKHLWLHAALILFDRCRIFLALVGLVGIFASCGYFGLGPTCARVMLGVLALGTWFSILAIDGRTAKTRGFWRLVDIKEAADPIPYDVRRDANWLLQRFPGAQFFVHEFAQKEVALDPFFELRHAGTSLYIAHWGAPDYVVEHLF